MSPLPRPVKHVLLVEPNDAPLTRTWARLQVTRRLGTKGRRGRLGALVAVACGGLALALLWPGAPKTPPPADPAWTVSTLLAQGRQAPGTARPPHSLAQSEPGTPVEQPPPPPPPDVVGALFESAAEAVRASDFQRAAALLAEVSQHHREDRRAPAAMFALGRIQLDRLHRRADAASSFTMALESNPPEDLVLPLWQALQEARRAR